MDLFIKNSFIMFKKKKQREEKEINAGSMADIAFLLLIFFLVTTTINAEKGIMVKLPPWDPNPPIPEEINKRNVLSVKINKLNQVLVEGEESNVGLLRETTKEFIMNPLKRKDAPSSPRSAIVSIQNDRATAYEVYLQAYNEIKAAYNELWEEKAQALYSHSYEDLPKDMKKKIQEEIPLVISEAEPAAH